MSQTIKLKRGTSTPTTSNIVSGEVAIDTSARKLYVNDAGTIKEIGGGTTDLSNYVTLNSTQTNITGFKGFNANIGISSQLQHLSDSNTYLQFDTDRVQLVAGGTSCFDTDGKLNLTFNAGRYLKYRTGSVADLEVLSDNNSNDAVRITNTGTADILKVFDGSKNVFEIADGGTTTANGEFRVQSGSAYTTHFNYQDGGQNFISQANGGQTQFRNSNSMLMQIASTGNVTISNDLTVNGNFSVLGTTTTLNTSTLQVEDKNITLNYSSGDSSGSADGAGITIQDAVNSTTDASMTWSAAGDNFNFSHSVNTLGYLQHSSYLYSRNDLRVLNSAGNGWNTWATRSNGKFNLDVGTISSGAVTATNGNVTISTGYNLQWGSGYSGGHPSISATSSAMFFYPTGNVSGGNFRLYATMAEIRDGNRLRFQRSGNSAYGELYYDTGENITLYSSWGGKYLRLTREGHLQLSGTTRIAHNGDATLGQTTISGNSIQVFPTAAGAASVQLQRQGQSTAWSLAQGHTATDMFEILRGSSSYFSVNSSGNATFAGTVTAPYVRLTGTGDASLSSTTHPIQVGSTSAQNLIIDNNEVLSRNNGSASTLHLQADGGTVTVGAGTSANLTVSGTVSAGGIISSGTHTFTANDVDFIVQDTTDSITNYIWRDHSGSKLYLGTQDAVVHLRSALQINGATRIDMSGNATLGTVTTSGNLTVGGADVTITANVLHSGDGDTYFGFNANDSWRVVTGNEERIKANNGEVVINDNSANMDFRVESDQNTHAVFVDASANAVGICNSSVEYMFDVGSDTGAYAGGRAMRVNSSGDTIFSLSRAGTSLFSMRNNNVHYTALSSNNGASLMLGYGTGDAGAINDHLSFNASETVFNDSGQNRVLRIESDTDPYAFYLDGTNGNVSIGSYAGHQKLYVDGNIRADGHYYVGGSVAIDSNRRLYVSNGTAAAPSISFSADQNTGFYNYTTDQIGFAIAGAHRGTIDNAALRHFGREAQLVEKEIMRSQALAAPGNTTQRNRYTILQVSYNTHHWMACGTFKIKVETTYPICTDYAEYILQVGYLHTTSGGSQGGSGGANNDWVLTRVYSSKAKGNYDHEIIVGTPTDTGYDGGGYDIYQVPIYLENDHYSQHRVTIEADRGTFSRVTSFTSGNQFIFMPSSTATTLTGQVANPLPNNQAQYGDLYASTGYVQSTTFSNGTTYYVKPADANAAMYINGYAGIKVAPNASYALYTGGSIAQSSGSIYSYGDVVIGQGSLKKGSTTLIDTNRNLFANQVFTDYYNDEGGARLFRKGTGSGATRHLNLWNSTADPSNADDTTANEITGISWGQRSDNQPYYMIYVDRENYGGYNFSRLRLNWHTGIQIGASQSYGGTRFYNDSRLGGTGGSLIFSVGDGDNFIRAYGGIKVGATPTTVIEANRSLVNINGITTTTLIATQEAANAIKTRFIMGKDSGNTNDGDLYLNYASSNRVYIGAAGAGGLTVTGTQVNNSTTTFHGSTTHSGNNLAIFGPNSGWSRSLAIGGNANNSTSTRASIGATNGNLHIDAATGNFGTYLNFYDGTEGVFIGSGNTSTVAKFENDGRLNLTGSGGAATGYALSVNGTGVLTTGRELANVTASNGASGFRFKTNNWFYSNDNIARFYFSASSATFFRSANHWYFQNNSGANQAQITDTGNAIFVGNVTAYGTVSDIRLKEDIERIADPIDKVKQLDGITFNYKKDGSRSTGLIAQQLLEVLPEVVYETADLDSGDTHYAVRYGQVVGLLVEAIKDQQGQIDSLQTIIEEMKNGNN